MTPESIERTAAHIGAAAEGAVEGLFLVVALFLVTRALVLAAPGRGRRVSRWILALGIPTVLGLAVLARMTRLRAWDVAYDSFGLSAIALSLPLALVWLVALIVRGVRRLAGTPRRRAGKARREDWALLVVAVLIALMYGGLVVLIQWTRFDEEEKGNTRAIDQTRNGLRALEATEERSEEFESEWASLREKVDVLTRMLPPRLDVLSFMESYSERCEGYNLEVGVWKVEEDTSHPVHRADIDIELRGTADSLEALGQRTGQMSRQASWRVLKSEGRRHRVRVTVYAMPEAPAMPVSPCASPPSRVFLWPLIRSLETSRRQRDDLCEALEAHSVMRAQVDEFQRDRRRLLSLIDEIEKIRGERGPSGDAAASTGGAAP